MLMFKMDYQMIYIRQQLQRGLSQNTIPKYIINYNYKLQLTINIYIYLNMYLFIYIDTTYNTYICQAKIL